MTIPFIRSLTLASCLLALGACSWIPGANRLTGDDGMFRDRQGDYLEAATIPRTRVPDTLDSYMIDDLYVIPPVADGNGTAAFLDAPRPRPLEGRSEREVVIQRIGARSWVVVDASPSQVWPRIRDYWTSKGVTLSRENPTAGLMETAWFQLDDTPLTKEKFRITVEPGFQDNSSEIRLLHASTASAVPTVQQIGWPESSADQELAFDILSEMSGYLADVADLYQASSVSFLAGNIPSEGKASLVTTPGARPLLRLEADYIRSWAALGRALERAGVEVTGQSEAEGIYEVEYTIMPPGEEKGFFGKLFSFGRDRPQQSTHNLRVRVIESGQVVEVLVENPDGATGPEGVDPEAALLQTLMSYIA